MCGIVAVYGYGPSAPPIDVREVLALRDAMSVRGPDAAGHWVSEISPVALAHRRLSIIDTSANGNQPMLDDDETCVTFNGEIYNYRELRAELEQRGHVFRTNSDTEVILKAYREYGAEMLKRLRGMYAFAIWDARRRGMFLARDPFGIKPLYYADDGQTITAASQVKALLETPRIDRRLNPAGQVSFLLWGFIVEPHTLYREIRALPAGTSMWVDASGVRQPVEFWSAHAVFRDAEARAPDMDLKSNFSSVLHECLRDALLESVRYHMVSDVPVGIFLSGGLDSGTLVALASEHASGDLRAMTLGFDELRGTPADELPYATKIAERYGVRHDARWIGSDQFARDRTRLLDAMDQPSIDGVNVFFMSQMAASFGLKVAMSGLGGDELFGGYPTFRQIPRLVSWLAPFAATPRFATGFRHMTGSVLKQFTSPKYAGLLEYGTTIEDAYLLRRSLFMPWELPEILDPDLAREGWQMLGPKLMLGSRIRDMNDDHAKVATLEMEVYMRNQLLRDSDWAGMAHSLEIRVPFVDATLLERIAPLLMAPTQLGKGEMARTASTPLPSAVLDRPKTGFAVPVRDWLLKEAPSRPGSRERGLRGWAKYLLGEQLAQCAPPSFHPYPVE